MDSKDVERERKAPQGVRVLKLKWRDESGLTGQRFRGDPPAPFSSFCAWVFRNDNPFGYKFMGRGGGWTVRATVEEAQADAQADYERRILTCIEPAPMSVQDAARVLLGDEMAMLIMADAVAGMDWLADADPENDSEITGLDIMATAFAALAQEEDGE